VNRYSTESREVPKPNDETLHHRTKPHTRLTPNKAKNLERGIGVITMAGL
jgi:hypothetical protein